MACVLAGVCASPRIRYASHSEVDSVLTDEGRHPLKKTLLVVLVAWLSAACGGGGDNGGSAPPPPPTRQVYSTPTAVKLSQATPFAAGCLAVPVGSTLYTNAEVEPSLAVDAADPNHLVATWQQDRLSDGGARGLLSAASVDGGVSWSAPVAATFSQCAGADFARTSDPWVSINGTTVAQVGISFTGVTLTAGARSAVVSSTSQDGGFTWSPAVRLADDDGSQYFNDKESVTVDPADPHNVYAAWDRLDVNDRGPAIMARSVDGGISWTAPAVIYDPGPGRQTVGNVVVVALDGTVLDFFSELGPSPTNPGQLAGQLRVIRSGDHGLTWSAPSTVVDLLSVGVQTRTPPLVAARTSDFLGSFAVDPGNGTLYAAWQDARFSGGARDGIALSWSLDGGLTWSAPVAVNGDAAAPAFTPTVAVAANGSVGISYYDMRQAGTSTFQPVDFWLTTSSDRSTWFETRLAGNFDLRNAPDAGGLFLGDYEGLVGQDAGFAAVYVRTSNADTANRTDVFADRLQVAAATAGLPITGKVQAPRWTAAAGAKVSMHVAGVREARRQQWQRRLHGPPEAR